MFGRAVVRRKLRCLLLRVQGVVRLQTSSRSWAYGRLMAKKNTAKLDTEVQKVLADRNWHTRVDAGN